MSFQPTLLEDCLDRWLPVEPILSVRETVMRFLLALRAAEGRWDDARPVPGTKLPAFAAMEPGAGVVVVWVIAELYSQLAIRYLYNISSGQRFGG